MITIIMYNEKWRIIFGEEILEFENVDIFKEVLEKLINIKDKYGRIK